MLTVAESEKWIELTRITMVTAEETLRTCRSIIEALSPKQEPKLIGLRDAARMINRSTRWLRGKAEAGELTAWQNGKGGRWNFDPVILTREMKGVMESTKQPEKKIRRRKRALTN